MWRKCFRRRGDGWLDGDVVNLLYDVWRRLLSISVRLNWAPECNPSRQAVVINGDRTGEEHRDKFPHSEISSDATSRQNSTCFKLSAVDYVLSSKKFGAA